MEDKALLEAIGQMMDEKLEPIKQDIPDLKEDVSEIRDAQNYLIGWVDNLSKAVNGKK